MPIDPQPLARCVFFLVMASWCVFAGVFLLRKRPPKAPQSRSAPLSRLGIALQGAGYALVWFFSRRYFTPIVPMTKPLEIALAILTVAIAVGSVWLIMLAVRTLGKQWALVARVVEGHKLVTEGPYARVRNPIYTGMFGMLLATGLAVSRWPALLAAVIVFLIGNSIRLRSEEKLLRESFGAEFDDYARRVPAMFPRLF